MTPLNAIYFYNKTCNLACKHCWIVPSENRKSDSDLTFDDIKQLFLQGKELGMKSVKFSGGEPLLLPDIKDILQFLIDEKIHLIIETNGTLINDEIAELLKKANAFVSISLDGPNAEVHSFLRINKDSFSKAVNGINLLVNHGIRPQIIFSVHKKNEKYLPEMIDLSRSLNANSMKINFIMDLGRGEKMSHENELLSVKESFELFNSFKNKTEYDGFKVIFDVPPAFCSISDLNKSSHTCGIKGIIGVLSDGDVSICGIGNVKKDLVLGNIREISLKEIWEKNQTVCFIRENIPNKLEGICQKCILRNACLGKCVAKTFNDTDNFLSGNPFCEEAYKHGLFPLNRLI